MNLCGSVKFLDSDECSSLRAASNKSYPDLLNAHKALIDPGFTPSTIEYKSEDFTESLNGLR